MTRAEYSSAASATGNQRKRWPITGNVIT